MNITNAVQALGGWGLGYQLGAFSAKVDEIQQGQQYLLASGPQWLQFATINNLASLIVKQTLSPGMLKTATNVGLFFAPWLAMPAFPFCAVVKHDWYNAPFVPTVNQKGPELCRDLENRITILSHSEINAQGLSKLKMIVKRLSFSVAVGIFNRILPLPEALSPRTITLCCFVSKHSHKIMRVTGIVTAVALTAFMPHVAYGMLAGVLYEAAKSRGYVPHKICLFVETYSPLLSAVGVALSGGLFAKLQLAVTITQLLPNANMPLQELYDKLTGFFLSCMGLLHPAIRTKISEYDAPLQNNKNMSYDEVMQIVEGYSLLEIDPAHCSKSMGDVYNLPSNTNFDHLMTHFNSIDWAARYENVKRIARDDDRFITFMNEQAGIPRAQLSHLERLDDAINALAVRGGVTKEAYLANWLQQQMQLLVDGLKGRRAVEGMASDLEEAKENVAKVLAGLDGMPHDVTFEDMLTKVAVEGGRYCARGVKRMSAELVNMLVLQGIAGVHLRSRKITMHRALAAGVVGIAAAVVAHQVATVYVRVIASCTILVAACVISGSYRSYRAAARAPAPVVDPSITYELPIRGALEAYRKRIYEGVYGQLANRIGAIGQDVHMADIYRMYLSLGIVPVSQAERRNIGFQEMYYWNLYSPIRAQMLRTYTHNIDGEFEAFLRDQGKAAEFVVYVRGLIGNNPNLTPEQKNAFEEKFADYEYLERPDIQQGLRRLVLTSMGILKKPAVAAAA